jgi:hypothetical protein
MSDIFISYATADREKAKVLAQALEAHGWSVWWDRNIPPGRQFDEVIEEALDAALCVVVLWSQASIASQWVKTEAADAMRRKILVPVLIEDVRIPLEFRRLQAADLSHWTGDHFHPDLNALLNSLKSQLDKGGRGPISSPSSGKEALAGSPQGIKQSIDSLLAALAGLSRRQLVTLVLSVGVAVAVVVGYALFGTSSTKEADGSEQGAPRQSAQTQTGPGVGTWISDSGGCKHWNPRPEPNESITWSGSCLKGKADGPGTEEWLVNNQKIARITGRFSEGKLDGGVAQVYTYNDGSLYEGSVVNGKPAGRGTITTKEGVKIEGNFVDGMPSGNVVIAGPDGTRYEGALKDGKRVGKGVLTEANGVRYAGDFVNGKANGRGIATWPNGNRYEGDFKDSQRLGRVLSHMEMVTATLVILSMADSRDTE